MSTQICGYEQNESLQIMAKNLYFSDAVTSEQRLYENIVIESLKMYGQDVYYLPREVVSEDSILGEDIESRFISRMLMGLKEKEIYLQSLELRLEMRQHL